MLLITFSLSLLPFLLCPPSFLLTSLAQSSPTPMLLDSTSKSSSNHSKSRRPALPNPLHRFPFISTSKLSFLPSLPFIMVPSLSWFSFHFVLSFQTANQLSYFPSVLSTCFETSGIRNRDGSFWSFDLLPDYIRPYLSEITRF